MSAIQVEKIASYTGHRDCVYALAPSGNSNCFISAAGDGMVVRWDFTQHDQGELLAKVDNSVYAICTEGNDLWLGQNFKGVHKIDLSTKKEVASAAITTTSIFDLKIYKQYLIAASGDGVVTLMDKNDLSVVVKIQASTKSARTIAISEARQELAVGYSDHCIRVYSLQNFQLIKEWQAHDNSVFTLAYSPDSHYLLSGSRDARLKVWNVFSEYALQQVIVAHMYAINQVNYSACGSYFVTCSMDKSIKVWDAKVFRLLKVIDKARYAGHGTSINKVLWTNYHDYIVSASDDRTLSVWKLHFGLK